MRRIALVLLVIPFILSERTAQAQCRVDLKVTPSSGTASLPIKLTGTQWGWNYKLDIDMGGEEILHREFPWEESGQGVCDIGQDFSGEHEFYCPGTYQIRAYDPAYPEGATTTTSVTVNSPPKFHLYTFAGDTDHESYVATLWSESQRPFTFALVNWGDGTSNEVLVYTLRGLYAGSHNHTYAADGTYTATVTHHYVGAHCQWKQAETITVTIPNTTTPTAPSTWGRVKAMYRE